jgi:hypothetical protein
MIELLMNNELERIWKESVVASFKVLSRRLPGGSEENHEKIYAGWPVCEPRFEPVPPKYEAGMLTTRP